MTSARAASRATTRASLYLRALEASRAGRGAARAAATLEKLAQLYRLTGEVESAKQVEEQQKQLLASGAAR